MAGEMVTTSNASPVSAEPLRGVSGHLHCGGASQALLGHLTATVTTKWDINTPRMGLCVPWTLDSAWVFQGKQVTGAHSAGGENQRAAPSQ